MMCHRHPHNRHQPHEADAHPCLQTRATVTPDRPNPVTSTALFTRLLATLLLLPWSPTPVRAEESQSEILVKFKSSFTTQTDTRARIHQQLGGTLVRTYTGFGWDRVRLSPTTSLDAGLINYRARPEIEAAEPLNHSRRRQPVPPPVTTDEPAATLPPTARFATAGPTPITPNDPRWQDQWNLRLIGMPEAWTHTTGDSNVVVAILDSGIDPAQEDLMANLWRNPGETGLDNQGRDRRANGVDDDGDGFVDNVIGMDYLDHDGLPRDTSTGFLHGTAVAGIIGARGNNGLGISGVCWNVQLLMMRIFGPEGSVDDGAELAALDDLIRLRHAGVNIRVSNHSYGGDLLETRVGRDAYRAAGEAGILLVFAAGNDGLDSDRTSTWPEDFDLPYLVNVAATDSTDSLLGYSNTGHSTVDLAAPSGASSGSAGPPSTQAGSTYATRVAGTSFAAPHVTGAAALLAAAHPELGPIELKAALLQSVDHLPGLVGKTVTGGRLNVARALNLADQVSRPPVVVGASPATSRTPPNTPLEVTFSQPMDTQSVEAAFELAPAESGRFSWTNGNRTLRFQPDSPFQRMPHHARIRASARSTAGFSLDGNYDALGDGTPGDDAIWEFGFGPDNDNYAEARVIEGGSGSLVDDNRNGSAEESDPLVAYSEVRMGGWGSSTLWYRWRTPSNAWITFETLSTNLDTVLGAWTGSSLTNTTNVAFNDDDGLRHTSRISFLAAHDTDYTIGVVGRSQAGLAPSLGSYTLAWHPTPPPVITDFLPTNATPGSTILLYGTNFTGTTRALVGNHPVPFTQPAATNFDDVRLVLTLPPEVVTGPITLETPHGTVVTASVLHIYPAPTLGWEMDGNGTLTLSWPDTATGFQLQSTQQPANPDTWANLFLPPAPITIPGIVRQRTSTGQGTRFYRLQHP